MVWVHVLLMVEYWYWQDFLQSCLRDALPGARIAGSAHKWIERLYWSLEWWSILLK